MARARKASAPAPNGDHPDEVYEPVMDPRDEPDDLDFLTDSGIGGRTWYLYRHRSAAEMQENPRGRPKVLVTKMAGPVDILAVKSEYGGGVFEFFGKEADGSLFAHKVIELDGPRKVTPEPAPAVTAPVAAAAPTSTTDPAVLALLDRMDRRMEALELLGRTSTASQQPTSLKDLAETMVLLQGLNGKGGDPAGEVVRTYFAMVEKGIEIGQGREPSTEPTGTDWGKIIEAGLPILDRLISARAAQRQQRRPVAQPGAPGATAPPSSAEVVEPLVAVAEDPAARRWGAAVDALARAVQAQTDPELFADSLSVILEPLELAQLKRHTAAQVMPELAGAIATYPVLSTDATREYLEAVLVALNAPDEPEADEAE